jgi:hypothetical protein
MIARGSHFGLNKNTAAVAVFVNYRLEWRQALGSVISTRTQYITAVLHGQMRITLGA